jgi:hypothetical protein
MTCSDTRIGMVTSVSGTALNFTGSGSGAMGLWHWNVTSGGSIPEAFGDVAGATIVMVYACEYK